MEDIERIKQRLDNVQSVAPILTALRNIAAGSWHMARARLEAARIFGDELSAIYRALHRHLHPEALQPPAKEAAPAGRTLGILVIASERGLCGSFNSTVIEAAEQQARELGHQGYQVELLTLGARATTYFRRQGRPLLATQSLPVTTVASLAFVQRLHQQLAGLYETGALDQLYALYTPYQARAAGKPVMRPLLPIQLEQPPSPEELATEPIIDTDPELVYKRVLQQWSVVELYRCVMESAASEQSARYQVLDGATNNSQRLIDELTLSYHTARQHAITMEMLDLVGGAGLLKPRAAGSSK